MDTLLDRKVEMSELESCWDRARRGESQLAVLWGRRRVGKTFLLSHFARKKRAVFFGATLQSESVELSRLAEAVRRDLGDHAADLAGPSFASWENALRYFAALATDEPLALILDEVPYLLSSTPGFGTVVQVVWDHLRRGAKLLLILTGSAVSVVEGLLSEGGPLRGRPTLARRLDPLDPLAARVFLPRISIERYFEAYAACGGYPLHLRAWDAHAGLADNLRRIALTPGGLLLQDAAGLLAEELSESGGYGRILASVGRGRTRFSEIASEAGQRIEVPLDVLVRAGFLRKALPLGAPKGAKPYYEIGDPYLAFWFSCLFAHQNEIEAGQGEAVWARIQPAWQRHLGWAFEEAARAHAIRLVSKGSLPRDVIVGRWWSSTGPQCEVDVLGLSGSKTALVGEARWQDRPLDLRAVDELRRKLSCLPPPIQSPVFALWGRKGATKEALRAGVRGYALADVLEP